MRRLLIVLLSLLTFISAKGNVNAEVCNVSSFLNVRAQPYANSEKVGQLENGTPVEIINDDDSEWVHIVSGSLQGYVKSQYLHKIDSQPKQQKQSKSILGSIWHWYVEVFWSTSGFWGFVLGFIGVVIFILAIVLLFYGFGILLHGIVGAIAISLIGFLLSWLGVIEWQTANGLFIYGFYIGLAVGIIRLIFDHNGFLSIFDGAGGSSRKSFKGKTFTGYDEDGHPITLDQTYGTSEIHYHDPTTGRSYERDNSGNFHRTS